MFRPRGVVNPIGDAPPGRPKVLTWPVARVSTSVRSWPEKAWKSARWPSGDQASSCGADREFGQRASWYLVPPGLIRYSVVAACLAGFWLGLLAAIATGAIAGFVVERAVFLRVHDREITFSMITSFGILIGGVGIIKLIWGLAPRPVPEPISAQINLFQTDVPAYRLLIVAIALAVYSGIWLFLHRTIVGKAICAGIEDAKHVEGLGINIYRLFSITFVIAGALSALAGGLYAPLIMVDPQMGLEVLAFAFMIVIIGGLGSIKGTLVSAFLIGQVVSLGSLTYAPLAQMAPFAIMLLILTFRPSGLFGIPLKR